VYAYQNSDNQCQKKKQLNIRVIGEAKINLKKKEGWGW
jgi:hypothetical protein